MSAYTPGISAELPTPTRESMLSTVSPANVLTGARPESSDTAPSMIIAQLKVGLTIIGTMAVGALIISSIVLDGELALIGFCVALSMMAFIGMPLILAAMGDAAETETTP